MSVRIGSVEIEPPVVLAPMAGTTNHAFRLICREFGAGAVWTDMISACGIHYRNSKTLDMFDWTQEERPVAVQIFGADPAVMANAAQLVADAGADIVDINIGCPAPKVAKTGAGAGLIRDIETARSVIKAVVKAVRVPVTIKTRKGLDGRTTTAVDLARVAEDMGISAVAVHGRTVSQGYSGKADWGIIAKVKQVVRIPVIGNGDVKTPEDAGRMMEQTGCDLVMIGRASLGNPWVFKRTAHFLETGKLLPEPTIGERVEVAKRHLRLMVELYGGDKAVREMRGQITWYIKGTAGASRLRALASKSSSVEDMLGVIASAAREQ